MIRQPRLGKWSCSHHPLMHWRAVYHLKSTNTVRPHAQLVILGTTRKIVSSQLLVDPIIAKHTGNCICMQLACTRDHQKCAHNITQMEHCWHPIADEAKACDVSRSEPFSVLANLGGYNACCSETEVIAHSHDAGVQHSRAPPQAC